MQATSPAVTTDRLGFTFASIMGLGPQLAVDTARRAEELGLPLVLDGRDHRARGVLGAGRGRRGGARASTSGTGVLALQLRTPMVVAMAGATLQALQPDREVLLGVGISSPVVTKRWHGVDVRRPSAGPRARVRHLVKLCLSGRAGRLRRRLLHGQGLPARCPPRRAPAEGRRRRAQPEDAARSPARWPTACCSTTCRRRTCRGRSSRCQSRRRRHRLRLRPRRRLRREDGIEAAPARPLLLRGGRRLRARTSSGPATATRWPRCASATPPATAKARSPRSATRWSTAST